MHYQMVEVPKLFGMDREGKIEIGQYQMLTLKDADGDNRPAMWFIQPNTLKEGGWVPGMVYLDGKKGGHIMVNRHPLCIRASILDRVTGYHGFIWNDIMGSTDNPPPGYNEGTING